MRIILKRPAHPTRAQELEARAWQAVRRARQLHYRSPGLLSLASELSLVLDQVRQFRGAHAALGEELNRSVRELDADRNREMRKQFQYETPNLLLVERLRARTLTLQSEARRLKLTELEGANSLQDRLMMLLIRQQTVGRLYDTNRGTRASA